MRRVPQLTALNTWRSIIMGILRARYRQGYLLMPNLVKAIDVVNVML